MAPTPTASLFLSPPVRLRTHLKPRAASSPSLTEQLEPLSRTLLHDKPTPAADLPTPEPTWVNPSRPKPNVLSLRRQRRR
jgi:hypothetical protein